MTDNHTDNYDDIINLPHHRSTRYPHMSPAERAAQFSPFAALNRFGEVVRETAHETIAMPLLSEDDMVLIDRLLRQACDNPTHTLRITYFAPDETNPGGTLHETIGSVKRLDPTNRTIHLENGQQLPIDCITDAEWEE